MIVNIPEWGVIVSLLCFALTLAGVASAIYSRIGRLEGVISAKLNGNLEKLVNDVTKNKEDTQKLRTEFSNIQITKEVFEKSINEIRGNCQESSLTRFQLEQDMKEIKEDLVLLRNKIF